MSVIKPVGISMYQCSRHHEALNMVCEYGEYIKYLVVQEAYVNIWQLTKNMQNLERAVIMWGPVPSAMLNPGLISLSISRMGFNTKELRQIANQCPTLNFLRVYICSLQKQPFNITDVQYLVFAFENKDVSIIFRFKQCSQLNPPLTQIINEINWESKPLRKFLGKTVKLVKNKLCFTIEICV